GGPQPAAHAAAPDPHGSYERAAHRSGAERARFGHDGAGATGPRARAVVRGGGGAAGDGAGRGGGRQDQGGRSPDEPDPAGGERQPPGPRASHEGVGSARLDLAVERYRGVEQPDRRQHRDTESDRSRVRSIGTYGRYLVGGGV